MAENNQIPVPNIPVPGAPKAAPVAPMVPAAADSIEARLKLLEDKHAEVDKKLAKNEELAKDLEAKRAALYAQAAELSIELDDVEHEETELEKLINSQPADVELHVVAEADGWWGHSRRVPGEKFTITNREELGTWMKVVGTGKKAATKK